MFFSIVIGSVVLAVGVISFLFPPKKINPVYGYRTEFSTKNIEIWQEGNKYCAKQYLIAGVLLLIIGVIGYFSLNQRGYILPIVGFIPVLYKTVFTTEKHLKSNFDSNGYRIQQTDIYK